MTFDNLKEYITHISNIESFGFIKSFIELNINNRKKEYFQRLRFYSNINKNIDIIRDLEIILDDDVKIESNRDKNWEKMNEIKIDIIMMITS